MPYDEERHGPRRVVGPGFHDQVYRWVKRVPAGHVSTYGDIATQLGLRTVARHVGFALAAIPENRKDIPWHRIVAAGGKLSPRSEGTWSREQAARLASEGIEVSETGRIRRFHDHRWTFEEK